MDSTPELVEQLRLRLAEQIPSGGADTDTLFTAAEIDSALVSSSSLDGATLLGWIVKAALLERLVDTAEADSSRKLSQRFANAKAMVKIWSDRQAAYEGSPLTPLEPVVGVSIDYLRPNEADDPDFIPHAYPNYPYGF